MYRTHLWYVLRTGVIVQNESMALASRSRDFDAPTTPPVVRDFVEADFGHFSKMTFCKIQNLLKDLTKGLVFVKVRIRQAQIKKSANL